MITFTAPPYFVPVFSTTLLKRSTPCANGLSVAAAIVNCYEVCYCALTASRYAGPADRRSTTLPFERPIYRPERCRSETFHQASLPLTEIDLSTEMPKVAIRSRIFPRVIPSNSAALD